MKVLHISAECYPAAKAGGLGDVVGALPKYLNENGVSAGVIIPKYQTNWIGQQTFNPIFKGTVRLHNRYFPFTIEKEAGDTLGFPFFVANIPGKFDRPGIYADPAGHNYGDELERNLCFQQAVLRWISQSPGRPEILHCHDHHTGLIPFMVKHCPDYRHLRAIPTIFTIHNGEYHGAFGWDQLYLLPPFEMEARGLLDWNNQINPLATAIKLAWRVTTVSPSYLQELKSYSNGLEMLMSHEQQKCIGIINGIDRQVWDPRTDPLIVSQLKEDIVGYKKINKGVLVHRFNIDPALPLITFIGRLVREKGADLLPDLIRRVMQSGEQLCFVILGTGEPDLHQAFQELKQRFAGRFDVALEYNEGLAHQLYAGSDYLIMPSRVEPCGLNQMYAMAYGTIPIVRSVGGLRDTVPDIGEPDGSGRGIRFDHFNLDDAFLAIYRAIQLYYSPSLLNAIRKKISLLDFSWERSAEQYQKIYNELTTAN